MAEVSVAKRSFKYNSMDLADPDINMTPDEVRVFYSGVYPELTQSVIEGPEYKGDTIEYIFRKSVGTKGLPVGGQR